MALVKSFTDNSGNINENSYWVAVQNNFCSAKNHEAANVIFYGYKDKASHDNGLQNLSGAVKTYNLSGLDFIAIAQGPPVGTNIWDVIANAVESHAMNTKDVESEQKDSNGNPIMISFFDGATQSA